MVRYQLTDPITEDTITIAHEARTADSVHEIVYEGDNQELIEDVRRILSLSAGIYGHLIGTRTSILDLNFALMNSEELGLYSPELIEGEIPTERSQLPEGAQT